MLRVRIFYTLTVTIFFKKVKYWEQTWQTFIGSTENPSSFASLKLSTKKSHDYNGESSVNWVNVPKKSGPFKNLTQNNVTITNNFLRIYNAGWKIMKPVDVDNEVTWSEK